MMMRKLKSLLVEGTQVVVVGELVIFGSLHPNCCLIWGVANMGSKRVLLVIAVHNEMLVEECQRKNLHLYVVQNNGTYQYRYN